MWIMIYTKLLILHCCNSNVCREVLRKMLCQKLFVSFYDPTLSYCGCLSRNLCLFPSSAGAYCFQGGEQLNIIILRYMLVVPEDSFIWFSDQC